MEVKALELKNALIKAYDVGENGGETLKGIIMQLRKEDINTKLQLGTVGLALISLLPKEVIDVILSKANVNNI